MNKGAKNIHMQPAIGIVIWEILALLINKYVAAAHCESSTFNSLLSE